MSAIPTDRDGFAVPTGAERALTQMAPYPVVLETLVGTLRYKAGWRFWLQSLDRGQGSKGLTLVINITGPDAYHSEEQISVNHYMLVPPASYDMRSWRRWLFDQIGLVERHERMEWFQIFQNGDFVRPDGSHATEICTRPYAPSHGFGQDPYLIREIGTKKDQRTSFRNEVKSDDDN